MIRKTTLRYGVYIAVGALILTLTGIFAAFEERAVIAGGINLSTVLLFGLFVGAGFYTAQHAKLPNAFGRILNGVAGSVVVAIGLALLVAAQSKIEMTFVFANLKPLLGGPLTFGQTELGGGISTLLVASAILGGIGGLLTAIARRPRQILVSAVALTAVLGLLEAQINAIVVLPDALALTVTFALGYAAGLLVRSRGVLLRLGAGLGPGLVLGFILAFMSASGAFATMPLINSAGTTPVVLLQPAALLVVVFAVVGMFGSLATTAAKAVHNGAVFFFVSLIVLGILHWQGDMTAGAALATFVLITLAMWVIPTRERDISTRYEQLERRDQRGVTRLSALILAAILLIAPLFLGQYITDVLNLVGLYIIMGIGLNIVVGYAGLLDLGYVAFFAIGAYTLGLLTTPSLLTCGGIPAAQIQPEQVSSVCHILTFWEAWPVSVGLSALAGIMLGIPVLRLRGDYLAIVTLGFGEIIRLIVKFDDFKPLFGAAQGIANIPRPSVDLSSLNPAWHTDLSGSLGIYYLVLLGIVISAYVANRLVTTRLGRAWRAMRADEDVAQAMGVNLVRAKLLAFAIGAAFAGMGGAVAATRLYGSYPDSYTLQVSINVLSLIIIGGLGSIPGVIVGALVLVGLPEALRELDAYRLLTFGGLLIVMMIIRPEGLIPQPIRRLAEEYADRHAREGAHS